ncbi:hypothetical protein ACFT5B_06940 [Luteimicrobium sp. NPDC057192]|uniref:hypothetical protein n=1 Tax=Luteimicrobium sp. NPDC057192 TaxID=3346042 RepID=UPI0036317451
MAVDYTTAAGQVRLLIADVGVTQILDDAQITGYLAAYGLTPTSPASERAGIRRAAADALDAIATSEALVSKVIKTQDLSTNGAQVADALRNHAATLRDQAATDDDDASWFGVAEFQPYPATGAEAAEAPVWGW